MDDSNSGVCILATDGSYGMGILHAKDMLYSASRRLAQLRRKSDDKGGAFPVVIASPDGTAINSYSGTLIQPDAALNCQESWDLIILSHFWGNPKRLLETSPTVIDWVRANHERQTAILAEGSGVLWPAQAGLLDNREATTYWHYLDTFREMFPQVNWQPQTPITESGSICCVAGAASASDMLLHYITKLCGTEVAQGVNRDLLFDTRRAYEVPPLGLETHRQHSDYQIEQVQSWLDRHYSEEFEMVELAQHFSMSLRNFARRFERATGLKPLAYVQQLRTSIAKDMLVYSDKSIKHIALDVGYQDSSYFSVLFKRHTDMTPANYRQQYKKRT